MIRNPKNYVIVIIPIICGMVAVFLGKDVNWDLKNYHYYNAYAFWENRMDFDMAPAQLQTFINPLGDLPFYWMTKYFPAWVSGFILGILHGFNLSLLLLIFWKTFKHSNTLIKLLLGISIVVVSGIAPGFISELGSTINDNLTSLFVLGAIYTLITTFGMENEKHTSLFRVGFAGLIMGMGVGIKPSITIFAISSAFVFSALQTLWKEKFVSLSIYGFMVVIGGMTSAGFWWWKLWVRFGNPFFPFYNHIFKSSYFTTAPVNWSFFKPEHLWEYLAWPFIFSQDSLRVNQLQFSDIRFALLYVVVIAWLLVYMARKFYWSDQMNINDGNNHSFDIKSGNFILLFFLLSYILWIRESATYRFMIPLELLVPLCFLIILERFVRSGKLRAIIAVGAVCLTFLFFKAFDWGRLDWGNSYISVDATHLNDSGNPVVIMLGWAPMSYVIPQFPVNYRFVRPEGNLFGGGGHKFRSNDFFVDIKNLLEHYNGNIYILFDKNENIELRRSLENLDLNLNIKDCFLLVLNTPDELEFCRLFESE